MKKRRSVLLAATSLSHVAIRERVPDWEVTVEDEPLWSSSGKERSMWAFRSISRKKGRSGPNKRAGLSTNDVDA